MSRGRPKTGHAYKLRTRAWFNAVSHASKLKILELEVMFTDPEKQQRYRTGDRPGRWNKYKQGMVSPKIKSKNRSEPSLLDRVEKQFPQTKKWFTMPFWKLLSYDDISIAELKEIYLSLSPEVRTLITIDDGTSRAGRFWRLQKDPQVLYDELVGIGTMDAATAIFALVKEAEMFQNQLQFRMGNIAWAKCAAKLRNDPVIGTLLDEINDYFAQRIWDTNYFTSGDTPQRYRPKSVEVRREWIEHGPHSTNMNQTTTTLTTTPLSPYKRDFTALKRFCKKRNKPAN